MGVGIDLEQRDGQQPEARSETGSLQVFVMKGLNINKMIDKVQVRIIFVHSLLIRVRDFSCREEGYIEREVNTYLIVNK